MIDWKELGRVILDPIFKLFICGLMLYWGAYWASRGWKAGQRK